MQKTAIGLWPVHWGHPGLNQMWKVMKLTFFLLTAAMVHCYAHSSAQTVTISGKSLSFKQIFTAIEKQTGFVVLSNQEVDALPATLSVSLYKMELRSLLDIVLKDQPFKYVIAGKTIFLSQKSTQPTQLTLLSAEQLKEPIKGIVRDSLGAVLNGATIVNRRTKKTVQTNLKGEFTIEADEDDLLSVSYIGYEDKIEKVAGAFMIVVLKRSSSPLDEVQVIAYGTTSRRLGTGNVSTVNAKEIAQQPINNPLFALAARVPGLEVVQTSGLAGGYVNVRIRGMNAGGTSGEPLYIIDGTPFNNNMATLGGPLAQLNGMSSALNYINPNDIESISVLKDADATSIYGSRGANGVIVITTKKGKSGKVRINVTAQTGLAKVARKLNLMNTQQYLAMRHEAFRNDGIDPKQMDYKELRYPDLFVYDTTRYTDWQKVMIGNKASYNDYQLSISGGTPQTQYTIGGTLHQESTVFPGSTKDGKASVHFSINSASNDQKLKASLTGSYMSNENNSPTDDFTRFIVLVPHAPDPYKPDGSLNFGYEPDLNTFLFLDNPMINIFKPFESEVSSLASNAQISYSPVNGLHLKTSVGFVEVKGSSFEVSKNAASTPGFSLFNVEGPDLRGCVFRDNASRSVIVEPQFNYIIRLGKGDLSLLGGASYQHMTGASRTIFANGFVSDALMKHIGSALNINAFNEASDYKYAALFGAFNFNWDRKYILNLNARRDGSSKFSPGKQFGNFGSAAIAWLFGEEDFIKNRLPFISSGKIRSSYGTTGLEPGDNYAYLERYEIMHAPMAMDYQGMRGIRTRGLFANDYHWESTHKFEAALEGGFLKDRILFQIAYYENRTSNRLASYPLAGMVGPGYIIVNRDGVVSNSGIEISLQTTNIKSENFTWSSTFNYSSNKNKLVRDKFLESIGEPYVKAIGLPLDVNQYFSEAHVNPVTGIYEFVNKNGEMTGNPDFSKDNYNFYSLLPKFFGGISNTFTYKTFSLSIWLQFTKQVGKNYYFSFPQMPGEYKDSYGNQPVEVFDRWTSPSSPGKFQKFSTKLFSPEWAAFGNAKNSLSNFSDASYIRVKNISFSYEMPTRLISRIGLTAARLFTNAQNLLTFTNYKGSDPESQRALNLPPMKVVTFGIQLEL